MQPAGNDGIVRYAILDEVGPDGVLLFGCEGHPVRKFTSYMLESHMRTQHQATKFTVSIPSPETNLDEVKNAGTIIGMSENLNKIVKEGADNTKQSNSNYRNVTKYDRPPDKAFKPVPGPRQPRRG